MQARLHTVNVPLHEYHLKAVATEWWDPAKGMWITYDLIPLSTLTTEPELWQQLVRQQEYLRASRRSTC